MTERRQTDRQTEQAAIPPNNLRWVFCGLT